MLSFTTVSELRHIERVRALDLAGFEINHPNLLFSCRCCYSTHIPSPVKVPERARDLGKQTAGNLVQTRRECIEMFPPMVPTAAMEKVFLKLSTTTVPPGLGSRTAEVSRIIGASTFHYFGLLPKELQDKIMILATSPRMIYAVEGFKPVEVCGSTLDGREVVQVNWDPDFQVVGARRPATMLVNRENFSGKALARGYKPMLRTGDSRKVVYLNPDMDIVDIRHTMHLYDDGPESGFIFRNHLHTPSELSSVRQISLNIEDIDTHTPWAFENIATFSSLEQITVFANLSTSISLSPFSVRVVFEKAQNGSRHLSHKFVLEGNREFAAAFQEPEFLAAIRKERSLPFVQVREFVATEFLMEQDRCRLGALWSTLENYLESPDMCLPRVVVCLHFIPMNQDWSC